jgi:DNA-binding NarL/FixJ family response regulator
MRILVADAREKIRSALRLLIENEAGFEVAGEVGTEIDLAREIDDCRPDLLLAGWALFENQTDAALSSLRKANHDLRIIVLSGRMEVSQDAMAAGADDFFCKCEPPEELLSLIRKYSN